MGSCRKSCGRSRVWRRLGLLGVVLAVAGAQAPVRAASETPEHGSPDRGEIWIGVPDSVLAELRGGLRIGRFDIDLSFDFRDRINGREVFSKRGVRLADLRSREQRSDFRLDTASGAGVSIRRQIREGMIKLIVDNTLDGVEVQSQTDLEIRVRNFSGVLGDPSKRAGAALARRLTGAGL